MSTSKSLKFQFAIDQASFAQVKTSIQQLVDLTAKLGKNLQGVGGAGMGGLLGGITGGQQQSSARQNVRSAGRASSNSGLSDVVRQNLDLFKGLGKEGASSMNVLVDALKRATQQSQSELERQRRLVDSLTASYDRLRAAGKDALADKRMGQAVQAQASLGKMERGYEQLTGAGGTPQQSQGGGFFSSGNLAPSGRLPFIPKAMYGKLAEYGLLPAGGLGMAGNVALGVGAAIFGGAKAAYGESRAGTRAMNNAMAERGEMVSDQIRALRNLDISSPLARRLADAQSRKDLASQTSGFGAMLDAGVRNASSLATGIGKGMVGGNGQSIALMGLTGVPGQNAVMQNYFDQVNTAKKTYNVQDALMGYEYYRGQAGSRLRTEQIRGKSRANLGPMGVDDYTQRENALLKRGFSIEEENSAILHSRSMGLGGRFAGSIMSASAAGYGGYGSLLQSAAINRGFGGAQNAALQALGGGIEKTAGFKLGNMAYGYDGGPMTGGAGFLAAAQSGFSFTGGPQDQIAIHRIQAGLQAGNRILSGDDANQKGMNLISAIKAAPGLDTYSQDILANMDMKTLMDMSRGNLTDVQKNLGLTSGMAESRLSDTFENRLGRVVDQGGGDGASRAFRAMKESGLGLRGFLRQNKDQVDEFAALGMKAGMGSEEELLGQFGLLAGDEGGKLKKGRAPGTNTNFSDLTKTFLEAQAEANKKNSESLMTNLDPILKSLKTLTGEEGALAKFGADLNTSAKSTADSLNILTQAVDMASYAISKGKLDATSIKASAKNKESVEKAFVESKMVNMPKGSK